MLQTVEKIKKAIISLPKEDLARLRKWYDEFEAREWDQKFETDVKSGKLDRLAEKAINDFKTGQCSQI
jgi:hypothetical protein